MRISRKGHSRPLVILDRDGILEDSADIVIGFANTEEVKPLVAGMNRPHSIIGMSVVRYRRESGTVYTEFGEITKCSYSGQ